MKIFKKYIAFYFKKHVLSFLLLDFRLIFTKYLFQISKK